MPDVEIVLGKQHSLYHHRDPGLQKSGISRSHVWYEICPGLVVVLGYQGRRRGRKVRSNDKGSIYHSGG